MNYGSGTSIAQFPAGGILVKIDLKNQGYEVITGNSKSEDDIPILGLYHVPGDQSGRIVVYGDSNCLDESHMQKDCYWLLLEILQYTSQATLTAALNLYPIDEPVNMNPLPSRMEGNNLHRYSKVLDSGLTIKYRPLPACPHLRWSKSSPLNTSAPRNLYKHQKLLAVDMESFDELGLQRKMHPLPTRGYPFVDEDSVYNKQSILLSPSDTSHQRMIPYLTLTCIVVAVLLLCAHIQKRNKAKTIRRKRARLKKIYQGGRVPGV